MTRGFLFCNRQMHLVPFPVMELSPSLFHAPVAPLGKLSFHRPGRDLVSPEPRGSHNTLFGLPNAIRNGQSFSMSSPWLFLEISPALPCIPDPQDLSAFNLNN